MINRRKLLIAVLGGLVATAAVNADMVSVSQLDAESRQSPRVCGRTDLQPTDFAGLFDYPSVTDLNLEPVRFSPEVGLGIGQPPLTQDAQILTDGQSSLSLCLSALIGLGLCSSAHCLKKLSFGFIPEWYHNGGPFQIGHSLAVSPESLCPTPACCFVQPVWAVEDSLPQYRLGIVTSLWRKSQFTPAVVAPRGPPVMS